MTASNPECSAGAPNLAKTPPVNDQEMLRELRQYLAAELRRFTLSQREQTVAEVILDLSYGLGHPSVIIPRLSCFTEMTGLTKNNVCDTLKKLHETRILKIAAKDNLRIYTINPDSNTWQAHPRFSSKQRENAIELIKAFNSPVENADPKIIQAIIHVKQTLDSDPELEISDPKRQGQNPAQAVLNLSMTRRTTECPELF